MLEEILNNNNNKIMLYDALASVYFVFFLFNHSLYLIYYGFKDYINCSIMSQFYHFLSIIVIDINQHTTIYMQ